MIDLIICTYNRPKKVLELAQDILTCQPAPQKIIIVDSSDKENTKIQALEKVIYVRSNHKNQPYQRFLGYLYSKADYILYLDDDMEIQKKDFLGYLKKLLRNNNYSGIALNFVDKHVHTTLSEVPKSSLFTSSIVFKNFKNWFTGCPNLKFGKLGFCGNRGKQARENSETEYVSGGAFLAKRNCLFENFNFQLFDLFEQRIGMGEDALIGYGIHKKGKLLFIPEIMFLHNDQKDSSYSINIKDYAKRVLFSRLYLSLEKTRLDDKSLALVKIHFHWYALWRLLGLLTNYLVEPSINRKLSFTGAIKGWKMAFDFSFCKSLERNEYWESELEKNVDSCK